MQRPAGVGLVGAAAVGVLITLVVAASGPWTARFGATPSPVWTVDTACAVGTTVAVLGAAVVALAQFARLTRARSLRLGVLGCVVAVAGGTYVLVGLRLFPGATVAPVTVAIARFTVGPNQGLPGPTPDLVPTVLVVGVAGLVVLTVVGALTWIPPTTADTSTATRPVTVLALIGAGAVVLGGSLLPWTIGPDLQGQPLWQTPRSAVGAAVLLLAALATVALVRRRPAPRAAVVVATVAGLGGALLVASHTDRLRGYGGGGYSTYSFLASGEVGGPPSSAALHAATLTGYAGVGLVVLAALAVVALSALRRDDVRAGGT